MNNVEATSMVATSKLKLCAAILVAVVASSSANAQDVPFIDLSGQIWFSVNPIVTEVEIGSPRSASGTQSSRTSQLVPSSQPLTLLSFSPSLARRRINLANVVAKTRRTDPNGAMKMEQLFASTDPIDAMRVAVAPFGLRVDNVADAYTIYWVQAWKGANGDTSDPSPALMQAVRRQSTRALSTIPGLATATDATKQEFAEAMMVQALLISAMVDTYKDNPAMMRQIGSSVRTGAKSSGLDLDSMTLTPAGFVAVNRPSR
jgi:hypothetical protein